MKFKKIIAILIVLVMSMATMVGCGLFQKNLEKQLELVVAEVVEGDYYETITRRDLIVYYYNNGGEDYVNNQNASLETVLKAFLNQLVNRKIFLIEGMKRFTSEGDNNFGGTSGTYVTKYTDYKGAKFLTDEELENVEKSVQIANKERMNGFKDTILSEWYPMPEVEGTKAEKTYNPAPNAKPEAPTPPPREPKAWELPEEYFSGNDAERTALTTEIEKEAIIRLRKQIDAEDMTDEEYRKKQILAGIEQKIIEKYRDKMYADIRDGITGSDAVRGLKEMFDSLRKAQMEDFDIDPDKFFNMAKNPSESDFLLYYPSFGTSFKYVAVKNLLVKFSAEAEARLNELKELMYSNDPEYISMREKLIETLTAKDLRDPYDITTYWEGKEYTETFGADEDGNGEFEIQDFVDFIKDELDEADPTDYAKRVEKFVELIFAYGEDTGMFNNANDYIVAPEPKMGESETYVVEFANKAREFTTKGEVDFVVTDFGLHVLMCTDIVEVDGTDISLAFNYDDITNKNYDSVSYKFFNYIFTNKKETVVNESQMAKSEEYKTSGKVKFYYKNIEDLYKNR